MAQSGLSHEEGQIRNQKPAPSTKEPIEKLSTLDYVHRLFRLQFRHGQSENSSNVPSGQVWPLSFAKACPDPESGSASLMLVPNKCPLLEALCRGCPSQDRNIT